MERFAFILHPLVVQDMARKFPLLRYLPESFVESCIKHVPPIKVSHITGIRSPYAEAEGWFVACPLTARQMMSLPEEFVIDRIVAAGRVAEKLGAKIVGLGAFTSVVADAGVSIAKRLDIAVTSGNSYTVATALEGARQALTLMGGDMKNAKVAVLGATGSIGAVCSRILAKEAKTLTLVARNQERLQHLAMELRLGNHAEIVVTDDRIKALREADVVLAVTSALDTIIEPGDLKSGAVVCDVSRPRNVSRRVSEERPDVLVIEGGVVRVPGDVDFGFNFGFPPKMAYACMSETMLLALEGRYENYTLGRDLTVEQIETMDQLAAKHQFKLAGFRNFEKAITPDEIAAIQQRVTPFGAATLG